MTANDEQLLGNQQLSLSGSAADLPTTSAERGPEHVTHREWCILREVLPALTDPYIASANQLSSVTLTCHGTQTHALYAQVGGCCRIDCHCCAWSRADAASAAHWA
jgi:hypothetical protein